MKRSLIAWLSLGERTSSWVFVEAFLQGMREHDHVEERQFDMVYRFADGYTERLPTSVLMWMASAPGVQRRSRPRLRPARV
jgi:hypothetical protein